MKILKGFFVLVLFFNLITSCTADDITEESETNSVEKIQSTDDDNAQVDQTEKD